MVNSRIQYGASNFARARMAQPSQSPPAYPSGFHQRRVSMAAPKEEVAIQIHRSGVYTSRHPLNFEATVVLKLFPTYVS
jgi:hypothetical protein